MQMKFTLVSSPTTKDYVYFRSSGNRNISFQFYLNNPPLPGTFLVFFIVPHNSISTRTNRDCYNNFDLSPLLEPNPLSPLPYIFAR